MADAALALASQGVVLAATTSTPANAQAAQAVVLAASVKMHPAFAVSSQAVVLSAMRSTQAEYAEVAQAVILYAYKAADVSDVPQNAWSYTRHGHSMYVLTLGSTGTLVYDVTTQKWISFDTIGLSPAWNMVYGISYNYNALAAGVASARLFRFSTSATSDEGWKPVTRVATGYIPYASVRWLKQFSLRLYGSIGAVFESPATVTMTFSDDGGHNWSAERDVSIASGSYSFRAEWRSLGSIRAPGRWFLLTSIDGIKRIDSLDADVDSIAQEDGSGEQ